MKVPSYFDIGWDPQEGLMRGRAIDAGTHHFTRFSWPDTKRDLSAIIPALDGAEVLVSDLSENRVALGIFRRDCYLWVTADSTGVEGWAAGQAQEAARHAVDSLEEHLRSHESFHETVLLKFWLNDDAAFGSNSFQRRLLVPTWADISHNYTASTRGALDRLMSSKVDGRLVLWHGPPGGGKTHAVRAMAREWSRFARIEYITDPENFFARPQYMMDVLIDGTNSDDVGSRLIVLEDAGEFVRADARLEAGQGLSRLLNIVDGIIGQGLQLTLLITTNEDFSHIHPAIARPGRCAATVEFGPLSPVEADAWLRAKGVAPLVEQDSRYLADLYAKVEGRKARTDDPAFGYV